MEDIRDVLNRYDDIITLGNLLITLNKCDLNTNITLTPDDGQNTTLFTGTIKAFCELPKNVVDFYASMNVLEIHGIPDKDKSKCESYLIYVDMFHECDKDTVNSKEKNQSSVERMENNQIIAAIALEYNQDIRYSISANRIMQDYHVDEERARYILELMNMQGLLFTDKKEILEVPIDYSFEINGFTTHIFGNFPQEYITCEYCIFHSEEYCEQYSYDKNNTTVCNEFNINYKAVCDAMDNQKEKKYLSDDEIIKDFVTKVKNGSHDCISIKKLTDIYDINNERASDIIHRLFKQGIIEGTYDASSSIYTQFKFIEKRLVIFEDIPDECRNCNYCIYPFTKRCSKSWVSPPTTYCTNCDTFVPNYEKIEKWKKTWEIQNDKRTVEDLIKEFIDTLDDPSSMESVSKIYLAESLNTSIEKASSMIYTMMLQGLIKEEFEVWRKGKEYHAYTLLYDRIKLFGKYPMYDKRCMYCVYFNTDTCKETYIDPPPADHKLCYRYLRNYAKVEKDINDPIVDSGYEEEKPTVVEKEEEYNNVYARTPVDLKKDLITFLDMFNNLFLVVGSDDYKHRKETGHEPDGLQLDDFIYVKSTKVSEYIPNRQDRITLIKYLYNNGIIISTRDRGYTSQLRNLTLQSFYKLDMKKMETELNITFKVLKDHKEVLSQQAKSISYNMMKNTDEEIVKQFVSWVIKYDIDKVTISHMKKTFGLNKSRSNQILKKLSNMGLLSTPKKRNTGPRIVKREKCGVQYMIYEELDHKCGFCTQCNNDNVIKTFGFCQKKKKYINSEDTPCDEFDRDMNKLEKHCKMILDRIENE